MTEEAVSAFYLDALAAVSAIFWVAERQQDTVNMFNSMRAEPIIRS